MEKKEFIDYMKYINKVFSTNIDISDKELMATYYKPFEKIHINIAKEMAEKYMQAETGRFKLAKLLEYKSACLKGKTWSDDINTNDCKLCAGTGFVIVEEAFNGRVYERWKKCNCKQGDLLPGYIRKFDESIIHTHYRDYKGVFRLEQKDEIELSTEFISQVKSKVEMERRKINE